MVQSLLRLFRTRPKGKALTLVNALVDFSLAAPQSLDPEQLSDAVELLRAHGWDAQKAAQHVKNIHLKDFDDAMAIKSDDPFGTDDPPGPSC